MRLTNRRILLGAIGIVPLVSLAAVQPVAAATSSSDISVTIVATRDGVRMGQQVTYRVTMANRGPADAAFVDVALSWPTQLDQVSVTCARGISPDGPACEYSSLKAGQKVVSVFVATPSGAGPKHKTVKVSARVLFETDCSVDPVCTFDPVLRNNSAFTTTRLIAPARGS